MQFLPLLGKQLKDDEIIEVLESEDMDVVYSFDRLHEGQPDMYWSAAKGAGFRFGFDAAQVLDVIFLHTIPNKGFTAVSPRDCDIPFFSSVAEVLAYGERQRLQVMKGSAVLFEADRDWVRLGFATHSIHYEFQGGILALVTIARNNEQ